MSMCLPELLVMLLCLHDSILAVQIGNAGNTEKAAKSYALFFLCRGGHGRDELSG